MTDSVKISAGSWASAPSDKSFLINVKNGDDVIIEKGESSEAILIAILKSNDLTVGNSVQYATGYTKYIYKTTALFKFTAPNDCVCVWVSRENGGTIYEPKSVTVNGINALNLYDAVSKAEKEVSTVLSSIGEGNTDIIEVATAFEDDLNKCFVASKKTKVHKTNENRNIVAVNHDDLRRSDYIGTRKLYNKYGFKGNFNFILMPFENEQKKNEMISNVKQLIAEGHTIGLHGILNTSFWWMNKMADIRPNTYCTFLPTQDEIITSVDGNKNVFGYEIDSSKKLSQLGFANPSTDYVASSMSTLEYRLAMYSYSVYVFEQTYTGLDLNDTIQTWTGLQWLEHWYNMLIDNTLGYSKYGSSVYAKFAEDYECGKTEQQEVNMMYPDAYNLRTGKVVFFDDTTNPNFNNAEYQKVGRFKKGLFKGHASCCNYEVRDRIIEIAKAFCLHYFGTDDFVNFNRHGSTFINCFWKDDFVPYDESSKTIICGEVGKVFNTEKMKFENGQDILLEKGIKMSMHYTPLHPVYEGQVGLYYGQNGNRSPYFNHCTKESGVINYLALIGSTSVFDWTKHSYDEVMKFLPKNDVLKFVYENSGKQVTASDGTNMYIYDYVRQTIDAIRSCVGTGKIPAFSWDTLTDDISTMIAIELVCEYCRKHDIEIVSCETAREIANSTSREYRNNYFPNPKFNQSLLADFGGYSESHLAYFPDGWVLYDGYSNPNNLLFNVDENRVFNIKTINNDNVSASVKIYGLPSGKYKFSFECKDANNVSSIRLIPKKNNTRYRDTISFTERVFPSTTFVKYEWEFTVEDAIINLPSDSTDNQYMRGYEDNLSNIEILIMNFANTNCDFYIKNPKIELIS